MGEGICDSEGIGYRAPRVAGQGYVLTASEEGDQSVDGSAGV